MLFPTLEFALFFMLVFGISWMLVDRMEWRKSFLLLVSYGFYGYWDWRFLALLFASSLINYAAGWLLSIERRAHGQKWIVGIAVVANLAILGFFKYFGFFVGSLADALTLVGLERDIPLFNIILPIGISFFTFQGISYVIDIYRKDIEPVRSPLDLFLYISFFPQLVAGPIVRASDFLPQLRVRAKLTQKAVSYGLLLIVVGLFKKVVVASYLATEIVDDVFSIPDAYSSVDLYFAAHAFVVQIYCDFSGYSDIAIGVAALLGYTFKKNFDRPLSASSLQELWQRWHISLTSWLRDYLYRPLKGGKRGTAHMYRNLVVTMMVAGLWHGAAWTYVIWGTLQGVMLIGERWLKGEVRQQKRAAEEAAHPRMPALVRLANATAKIPLFGWFVTLNLFALTSIFFRAADMETVGAFFGGLAQFSLTVEVFTPFVALLLFGSLAVQFLPANILRTRAFQLEGLRPLAAGAALGIALLTIEMIGPDGVAPFIYFQF